MRRTVRTVLLAFERFGRSCLIEASFERSFRVVSSRDHRPKTFKSHVLSLLENASLSRLTAIQKRQTQ